MNLAIADVLSNSVTPDVVVVSPRSYQDFPVRLIIEMRVPAGITEVNRI
jgi:hypothetical protein